MDLAILTALVEMNKGQPHGVADIIEKGKPTALRELACQLAQNPEARERMARALRGGSVRKRGERQRPNHDKELFFQTAYWIGRGEKDTWQDSKAGWDGGTVWHRALECFPESYGEPSSLRKRWQRYIQERKPKLATHSLYVQAFIYGVDDAVSEMRSGNEALAFLQQQKKKARKYGFQVHAYPAWINLHLEVYQAFPELLKDR